MTREEAIARLKNHKIAHNMNEPRAIYISEALDMAIQALEQEPCDDTISRVYIEPIVEELENICVNSDEYILNLLADIKNAPSVGMTSNSYAEKCGDFEPSRRKGHWILADEQNKEDVENDNYHFICSECQCSDIHAKGTIVP